MGKGMISKMGNLLRFHWLPGQNTLSCKQSLFLTKVLFFFNLRDSYANGNFLTIQKFAEV